MGIKANEMNTIESDIEKLDSFASDLKVFFERSRSVPLFKKLPVRDEPEIRKQRLSEGRYMFRSCGVELNNNETNHIAVELLDLLTKHLPDRGEDLFALADALIQEKIKTQNILLRIIKNEGNEIRKEIRLYNLQEDLFTFFAVYLARPFREQVTQHLTEGIDKLDWFNGYCPVCGHWAALGHIGSEGGDRTLWCLCCNSKWKFKRTQCAYCLNEKHEHLEILTPENEESYRIQTCKKCKRYLKEVRSNITSANFPFDKFYLGTLPLDIIAAKEGYIQESVLTVKYDNLDGNEMLLYRQKVEFK